MGYTSPTPGQLLREAVIFWSIGLILYVGRMSVLAFDSLLSLSMEKLITCRISRILSGGSIKRLQADDYVMTVAFFVRMPANINARLHPPLTESFGSSSIHL